MSGKSTPSFATADTLLYRIADRVRKGQRVSFLFGTALTLPRCNDAPGVPGVAEMCRWLAKELACEATSGHAAEDYQSLFTLLIQRHGQETANQFIRRAVLCALTRRHPSHLAEAGSSNEAITEDDCCRLQNDSFAWDINEATNALGDLLTRFPIALGRDVFTTNFDPLIELACEQNGGSAYSIALHADGAMPITHSKGVRVVHLHGFWLGSDTLHTLSQVNRRRPKLSRSLARLLEHTLLVVVGYGGWDDVMMGAITDAVRDPNARPDIAWAFRDGDAAAVIDAYPHVLRRLGAGSMRGRANFYLGVDVHQFLPNLRRLIVNGHPPVPGGQWQQRCPAESLQRFLDLVFHRFLRERLIGSTQSGPDIGEEVQQLSAWGEHVPVAAAVIAAKSLLHIYENSLPNNPRHEDDQLVDFWPRRCVKRAKAWLLSNAEPPRDEQAMWPSIVSHAKEGREGLDRTIVDAVMYACEAVSLYRGLPITVMDPMVTSLVRAGQAVHCAMRVSGDDRVAVWGVIRTDLMRWCDSIQDKRS